MKEYIILRDKGGNCRGDRVMLSDADAAKWIADGVAASLDQAPPIAIAPDVPDQPQPSSPASESKPAQTGTISGKELWLLDRWPVKVADSLVAAGINTVADLVAYVRSGKKLESLDAIGKKIEQEMLDMYCTDEE